LWPDYADAAAVAPSELHTLESAHEHRFLVSCKIAAKPIEKMELKRARTCVVNGKLYSDVGMSNIRHCYSST